MIFLIEKIILERAGNDLAGKGFIYQLESKTRRFKLGFQHMKLPFFSISGKKVSVTSSF